VGLSLRFLPRRGKPQTGLQSGLTGSGSPTTSARARRGPQSAAPAPSTGRPAGHGIDLRLGFQAEDVDPLLVPGAQLVRAALALGGVLDRQELALEDGLDRSGAKRS
jgi:hypothetical protein